MKYLTILLSTWAMLFTQLACAATPRTTDPGIIDTKTVATPTAPASGRVKMYPKADNNFYVQTPAGGEKRVGDGSVLDVFYSEDFESIATSSLTVGNNANPLGGGALAGALAVAASPINGRSFQYTQAAGSVNDYFCGAPITLQPKQNSATAPDIGIKHWFSYNGNSGDIAVVLWDSTNSVALTQLTDVLTASSTFVPFTTGAKARTNTATVRWCFQVKVLNSGKILTWDDYELSTDPYVYANISETQRLVYPTTGAAMQDRSGEIRFAAGLTTTNFDGPLGFTIVDDAGNTRTKITSIRSGTADISFSANVAGSGDVLQIFKNGVEIKRGTGPTAGNYAEVTAVGVPIVATDFISVATNGAISNSAAISSLTIKFVAESQYVVTPAKSTLTDETILTVPPSQQGFAFTAANYASRRVGPMLHMRVWLNLSATAGVEARIGLPFVNGVQLVSAGSAVITNIQKCGQYFRGNNGATTSHGGTVLIEPGVSYVTFSGPQAFSGSAADSLVKVVATTMASVGDYVSFDAIVPIAGWTSDATFLAAIPVQKVAYVKDVKASGTNGGAFATGVQTRTLNTLEGDTSFISLASDQFTVGQGSYDIDGFGPAYRVDGFKCWLRNVTDSTDSIMGTSAYTGSTSTNSNTHDQSSIVGNITTTSPKTYSMRCQANTANLNTNGYGNAAALGFSEVYSVIKITKIR